MIADEKKTKKKRKLEDSSESSTKKKKRKIGSKKKKKAKVSGDSTTSVKLPTSKPEDISVNWRKLLETLPPAPKKPALPQKLNRRDRKKLLKTTTTTKKSENGSEDSKKKEIWFDDVDEELLDPEDRTVTTPSAVVVVSSGNDATTTSSSSSQLVKSKSFHGLTRIIGMDCEMVGVGYGGKDSILARVSIVNHFGHEIYDKFVKPMEKVTDYRTSVSGIRPKDLLNGEDFKAVQKEVSDILKGRILVGHAVHHDLKVLFLDHPRKMIRDTSKYKPFKEAFGGRTPSLKNLTAKMLGVKVQEGEHSSVQDAQAAVRLYTMFRKEWEAEIEAKRGGKSKTGGAKKKINEEVKDDDQRPAYVSSDDED